MYNRLTLSLSFVEHNNMPDRVRTVFIGTGGMAQGHIIRTLQQKDTTQIVAICEPSPRSHDLTRQTFEALGEDMPPNRPNLHELLAEFKGNLDAAFIITPHAYHHDQTKACLEAGLDVLLEKPMVINAQEANSLIETRDRTGRLLVVAFQGSLSPQVRESVRMIQGGELGQILNISGTVWQNWNELNGETWRTDPAISGGGFLFDTGAHMLNTVSDLVGEDYEEVAAWFDNRGRPVEILGVIMARTKSGMLVTINACGDTIQSCASDIRVFGTKGILRTGQWGERLELQKAGRRMLRPVKMPESLGVWEQFLQVRNGEIKNPSPPEVGLRMARLWDAVRASAAQNGAVVKVGA
jgi:predicted dehydrogenase